MTKTRTKHTPAFKAKVALAAIKEDDTIQNLSKRYGVHANQIYTWKRQFIANAERAFTSGEDVPEVDEGREEELLKKIGELTIERDFLAKGLGRRG
jgi:transposase-like protein